MNQRKLSELIPLFAIILMISGAVFLLIAMNSQNKDKKKTVDNNNNNTPIVNEIDDKNEDNNNEVFENNDNENNETTDIDENKSSSTDYINSMISGLIKDSQTGTSKEPEKVEEEVKETKEEEKKEETKPVTSKPVASKPTKPSYQILDSINFNGYVIRTTSTNLLQAVSGAKIVSEVSTGKINKMQVIGNYLYTVDSSNALSRYSANSGKLQVLASINTGRKIKDIQQGGDYIYVLTEDGVIIAYRANNLTQSGFVREMNGISSMSVSGTRVTAKTGSTSYTYTFNGSQFVR